VFETVTDAAALEEVAATNADQFQDKLDAADATIRRVVNEYIAYIQEYQRQYKDHAARAVELVRHFAQEHES
jgi:uncharacterized protein (DUF3084 family)